MKNIYNNFHKSTNAQEKIIGKNNFTYKIIVPILNKFLKRKYKVLDIGCGAGTLALYTATKTYSVIGIDISKQAVNAARKSAKIMELNNITFKVAKFPRSVPGKNYDLIIFTEVIEHLENDAFVLKKIYDLIKPGGIVILSTPSLNAPLYRLGFATSFDKRVGHLRRYNLDNLKELCKDSGFRVLESHKTEGIIRNSLFVLPYVGNLIRFIRWKIVDVVTFADQVSLKLFGESDLILVLKRP